MSNTNSIDAVIIDGRSAITRLQEIAKEFKQGKLSLATNGDVTVAGVQGEVDRAIDSLHSQDE